jgi:hypothetical protein
LWKFRRPTAGVAYCSRRVLMSRWGTGKSNHAPHGRKAASPRCSLGTITTFILGYGSGCGPGYLGTLQYALLLRPARRSGREITRSVSLAQTENPKKKNGKNKNIFKKHWRLPRGLSVCRVCHCGHGSQSTDPLRFNERPFGTAGCPIRGRIWTDEEPAFLAL